MMHSRKRCPLRWEALLRTVASCAAVICILASLGSWKLSAQSADERPTGTDAEAARAAAEGQQSQQSGSPVVLLGKELFRLYEPLGAYSAEERAAAISARLERIVKLDNPELPPVTAEESEGITYLHSGDYGIMTVTERDAKAVGQTRVAFVAALVIQLNAVLNEKHQEFAWQPLLRGTAMAIFSTLVLVVFFVGTRRLLRSVIVGIVRQRGKHIHDIRFQRTVLVNDWRLARALVFLARALWIFLLLVALYIYLPIVFRFFPYTRELSNQFIGYTLTPLRVLWEMFVAEIPNLFFVVVISVIAYYSIRLSRFLFHEVEKGNIELPGFFPDWAMPTYKIVRVMLIAFALVVAYPYIPGSDSEAFKGISIFFGLLFSLGSTGVVANVVSGVILTYTRAFVIGDRVRIGETTGDVVERTMLVTRLRTIKNVDVSVPNSVLISSQIVNYSAMSQQMGLILNTTVTIGYDVPWRQVHELLLDAARRTRNVLGNPRPFVLQTSLDDFSVAYELNVYTNQTRRIASIYSEIHANIQDAFNEAGVEIMSPRYHAHRDGNQTTTPTSYLPHDYQAPRHQVEYRRASGAQEVLKTEAQKEAEPLSSDHEPFSDN